MNRTCFIIFIAACSSFASAQTQPAFQPHETIYMAVREYITQHIASADFEAEITPLDSQLKLTPCPEPVEIFNASDSIKPGRNTIGVRCNAVSKWSIYTSAVIKIYQSVLVLTQPLQRGDTVTRQHVTLERKDVSSLRGDYVSQIAQIENKQAVRPLAAGAILSMRNIAEPKLIKRGDKITISSVRSDFAIRMNGLAMADGIKGQVIRIKNESSGRIISATVIEAGLVSVDH